MSENILIFGHKSPDTDSICSSLVMEDIQRKMGVENAVACRLGEINKETKYVLDYFKVEAPKLIEKVEEGQQVIMVDHNEFKQSVDGIENAKITSVLDHHRIDDFRTQDPLFYYAQPVGCTATILFELYTLNGVKVEPKIAGLMLSAIISDTLLLKSPTTTIKDEKALEKLAEIANINVEEYGIEMLKAGTDLDDYSEEELVNLDAKKMENANGKYAIAQVNTVDIDSVLTRQSKLEDAIKAEISKNDLSLFVLAITDILNSNSEIIALGDRANDVIKKAFGKDLENNRAFLEGVVSRKKQLLPNIDKNI